MQVTSLQPAWMRALVLWWVAAALLLANLLPSAAFANGPLGSSSSSSSSSTLPSSSKGFSVTTKICERPPVCFATKEARLAWAKANNCQFLEDVCEKAPASEDNKGAKPADKGFWGGMWDKVKSGLVYGYEFVKGLLAGVKDQVTGIIDLVLNIDDVVVGLIKLGQEFYAKPEETLKALAEVLGQEVIDTIVKATQCGPYDLGKVIGENVSPVLVAKLAIKIGKFSGPIAKAAKDTRIELGCASFAAGTPVWTPSGVVPIERVAVGSRVQSRDDRHFVDGDRAVSRVFGRQADHHHELITEFETLKVTDEHPMWLQGKGWTAVKELKRGDVLATASGDVKVLHNDRVDRPTQVYNFSVDVTPSYFVGQGVWAHNASCDLTKDWDKLTRKEKGLRGEMDAAAHLTLKGYTRVGNTFDPSKYPDDAARMAAYDGQTGIDGIFKNDKGEYIIIESKAKGGEVKDDVVGCVDKLCKVKSGDRQLSEKWTLDRLEKLVPNKAERDKIILGLSTGKTKRIYAQTDGGKTVFNEVDTPSGDTTDAVIGKVWTP